MADRRIGEPVTREGGVFAEGLVRDEPADDYDQELDFGEEKDPELWAAQRPLIEEDEDDGLKLEGFDEAVIPRILDAMGDDAAEPLPGSPGGTSATGSVYAPEHGGFPERD